GDSGAASAAVANRIGTMPSRRISSGLLMVDDYRPQNEIGRNRSAPQSYRAKTLCRLRNSRVRTTDGAPSRRHGTGSAAIGGPVSADAARRHAPRRVLAPAQTGAGV